jgi:hypothetical protein
MVSDKPAARNQRAAYQMNRKMLDDYKAAKGCADCGIIDYRVIQFHHEGVQPQRDVNGKRKSYTYMLRGSWFHLKSELDRLTPLCANCHLIRHYEEQNVAGD